MPTKKKPAKRKKGRSRFEKKIIADLANVLKTHEKLELGLITLKSDLARWPDDPHSPDRP